MKRIMRFLSMLMIVVALLSFSMVLPVPAAAGARLFVDPADSAFQSPPIFVGSTFKVNVTIANVTGLAGVQFRLSWDPTLLSCQGMQEVLFHTVTPSDVWTNIWSLTLRYNNTGGYADYAVTWMDVIAAVANGYAPANITTTSFPPEGKLALATLTMRVEKAPPFHGSVSCAFGLSNVVAGDMYGYLIPLTTMNGTYMLNWSPPVMTPFFSVDPPTYTASNVGEVFNISVKVNSLDPGWEAVNFGFKLGYNSTLLQVLNVWEGSWLPPYGALPNNGTSFVKSYGSDYVEVEDAVLPNANGTWHPPYPSAPNPNSFPLAIIEFNSTIQGMFSLTYVCALHPYDTNVTDWLVEPVTQDVAVDGLYQIRAGVHDVAATSVECSKTVIGEGYSEIVNVTVADVGNFTEVFNVTAYANTTAIGKEEAALTSGSSMGLMFAWNTTGYSYGNYTLSAVADTVPNETNTANNNMKGHWVLVTIPGDVNGDFTVDIYDAIILAGTLNSKPGDHNWNPNADINGDGIVDARSDAIQLSDHFNQHYP